MKRFEFLKHKKAVVPLAGGALFLAVVLGLLLRPADNADEDVIWREYRVERGDITASLTGGGTLNATGVHHGFDVELTIKQILVEPGQEVHAGDTLATYSKEAIQEKIDELNSSLETAQRTLADARNNKTRDTLQRNLDSQSGQSSQATYESQKRDIENNIQLQERKIAQLQELLAAYQQELRQASGLPPGEAMGDGSFAALIAEGEKYLGYPYVWGGSTPETSFDCSGFVCWVYTHSGAYPLSRTTATGIYNQCAIVLKEEAQPGDLVFFSGTYASGGPVSHVGIYVGGGRMLHCGSPIQYTSIETAYWREHFFAFGRLLD